MYVYSGYLNHSDMELEDTPFWSQAVVSSS